MSPGPASRLVAAAVVAIGLQAAAADAQLACSDCHEVELPAAAVHSGLGCADCHSDVVDYPHPEELLLGDAVCAQCHDAGDELEGSVHGGVLSCQECHGAPHEVLPLDDLDSRMSPIGQVSACGECHETEDGLVEGYLESVHGRALLRSGLVTAAPSCSDCHGGHGIAPVAEEDSRV
ncbi:MAG TPA: cytochrome c3 family protein, partial [Thermoanaerobaculia bacterium]|nr:cytochrome c3 family protein [Thermoanaerobaculia bacterium]